MRPIRRVRMLVLLEHADMNELQAKAAEPPPHGAQKVWQVRQENAWLNMKEGASDHITQCAAHGEQRAIVEHQWTHPKTLRARTTRYEVVFGTMMQSSGDSGTTRRVRLVLITPL